MSMRNPLPKSSLEDDLKFKSMLIDGAIDSIFVLDTAGRLLFVNEAAYKTRGYTKEEMLGMSLNDLDPPEFKRLIKPRIAGLLEKGQATFESAHICKDGSVMPVEIHARVIEVEGRKLVFSIIRDISKRKQTLEALRLSEQRLHAILDNTTSVIYLKDLEGRYILINRRYQILFGVSNEQIAGKTDFDLFPREAAEAFRNHDEKALKARKPLEFDEIVPQPDGAHHYLSIKFPLFDQDQNPYAVCGISTDITFRKRVAELNEALNQINQAINSTLDFNKIMETVVIEATKVIGSESGMVLLKYDEHWEIKHAYGLPQHLIGRRFADDEARATENAIETKKPIVVNDAYHDERVNIDVMRELEIRSLCVVPLIVKEEAVGSLVFQYHSAPIAWREPEVDFARKLAASVSLSIANARLYAAERKIANTLQEALLTVPPQINGINFGHIYRSATESTKVGGDFYDIFEISPGRIAIIIGDVSGKGLEAATLTSVVKNSVKAFSLHETSPAAIMAKTNEIVTKASGSSVFVTLFLGILDVESRGFVFCGAGHPPALMRKARGAVAALESRSPAIGIFEQMSFVDNSLILEPDDILVLYTDGVTEARHENDFFGEDRLEAVIARTKPANARNLPGQILKSIVGFTGGNLADDVAVIAVSLEE